METLRRQIDVKGWPGTHIDLLRIPPTPNGFCSVFGEIEAQSQTLSAKGSIARLADKDEDTKVVARLVERLREAIVCYQVGKDCTSGSRTADVEEQISQQQSIYHHIADLTVRIFSLSRSLANNWSFYLVFSRDPLKTSRGDPVQQAHHSVC